MPITQANRIIKIDTPLGENVLLLRGLTGQEGISQLPRFELDLMTEGPSIDFKSIIGQRVTIKVQLSDSTERFFNGFISRFAQTGSETGLIYYRAEMVPWLWFLTRTADCRMFQNKTIPDIIEQIFKDLGFSDYRLDLQGIYQPLEFCIQYRETDYNFVARLMEQTGIFYFLEHEENKHTLVLADAPTAHLILPTQPQVKWDPDGNGLDEEDVITSLEFEKELRPGKFCHTDYNFKTPSTSLKAEEASVINIGDNGKYEIYDFPGEYLKKADGSTLAKIRMQEEEAQHYLISGSSNCRAFTSGYKFDLLDFKPEAFNETYLLTDVQHVASIGETFTREVATAKEESYSNTFTCIPYSVPFRPPQVTPKPVVQGPQTAVVVGPAGEEIWCDEFGRVKVQFHWDREGQKDENSSMWIRVSQLWAGKSWGAMFIPRIGQEVIVEFLEGDPDRPIITGRVYNAEQTAPYPLPAEQTKSTIKSDSSKGGGNSNELRFEDKAGSEEVYLHGAKDWTIAIDNDKNQTVGHDETQSIGNDRTRSVGNNETITITTNRNKSVGVDQSETVGANKSIQVGANHTETIGANMTQTVTIAKAETIGAAKALTIGAGYQVTVAGAMNESIGGLKAEEIGGLKSVNVGAASSENVAGNKSVDAGGSISESAGKNVSVNAGDNISEKAGKDVSISAGKNMTLTAADQITIKTGSASIVMKKNGDITINGKKIQVKASGDIIMKGKKILEN